MAEEKQKRASKTESITLLVAVLGIVGSVVTVIVGDQIADDRRAKVERRQTYRQYAQLADDFEEISVSDRLQKLTALFSALKDVQQNPANSAYASSLNTARSEDSQSFEQQWTALREVNAKYFDLRLIGSAQAIEAASELEEAVRVRSRYLIDYRRRMSGDPASVSLADVERFAGENASMSETFWKERREFWNVIEMEVRGLEPAA